MKNVIKRSIQYYFRLVWREYIVAAPAIVFEVLTRISCEYKAIYEIQVADPIPETRVYFNKILESALDLIAKADPVMFLRIKREIRYIISAPAIYGYSYGRPLKVCSLDLRCYYVENDLMMTTRRVAAALIYVATIGYLYSNKILRNRWNRKRCETFCFKEVQRFLTHSGVNDSAWNPKNFCKLDRQIFLRHNVKEIVRIFGRSSSEEAVVWEKLCKGDTH
jgi:hypothetical protein